MWKVKKMYFYGILSIIFENEDCMVYCSDFGIIGWVVVLPDCHGLVGGLSTEPWCRDRKPAQGIL